MINMIDSALTLYLTQLSTAELRSIEVLDEYSESYRELPLMSDWQAEFVAEIGRPNSIIPWNVLRAQQFDINSKVKTIVCCDPVVMQMTHRGAYLWGQRTIEFTTEEVIRIIAYINEKLMGEGENFYLLNNNQWLYTNEDKIELIQSSFETYIGKDMFGFSYQGINGQFWNKLATEIQMLIKQMIDYQGISTLPPEHLLNVHFWGNAQESILTGIEQSISSNRLIISDDLQMETYCKIHNFRFKPQSQNQLSLNMKTENAEKEKLSDVSVVIDTTNSLEITNIVKEFISVANQNEYQTVRIVTTDKELSFARKKSIFQRLKNSFFPLLSISKAH